MLELERTVTMQTARLMSLTPEMVKLCHRDVVDPGPSPDTKYLRDEDFRPAAEHLVSLKMPGPFWLFAYGSLIWKPEIPSTETKRATAHGWHRAFSMKIERYRGTKEQPGYMMCLDRNGSCEGVVLRLPDEDLGGQVEKLLRREISRKGGLDAARWIDVETVDGTSHRTRSSIINRTVRLQKLPMALPGLVAIGARERTISTTPSATWSNSAFMTKACGNCKSWWRRKSRRSMESNIKRRTSWNIATSAVQA
jgi:glutathione-specific gamma-glutamylcyclotransferase